MGYIQQRVRLVAALQKVIADNDQIGSGKYALTTDKTGKFWGDKGAGCIFYAKDSKKLLLAFRSEHVNEPHTWGVWGGAIDRNESPIDAVKREVKEETGYRGKFELEPIFTYEKGDFRYYNFLAIVSSEFIPKLDWETEDFGWFALNEFPTPLHFGLKSLLPHLKQKISASEG